LSVNPGLEHQQLGWKTLSRQAMPWALLWLVLVITSLFVRPPTSLEELKLLAVSWEMWQQDVFLLPMLNGFDNPDQAPLMPWLIMLGWKVFGVNDWWPRVLSALFSLMSLFVIGRISAYLWMDQLKMPRYTAFILLGSWLWVFYLTVSLADNMLTFFTLLGLYGILRAWRYTTRAGWFVFGFATGLAVLSNGMISLLYTMPVALFGPIWAGREHALRWGRWYIDLVTGLTVGVGLVALWGVVIMIEVEQGFAIALDHLTGALPTEISLFSSSRPMYWYLILLPVAILPWIAWPLVYSRINQIKNRPPAIGLVFCLVWIVPALLVLSMLGPRQPQFLLPLLPAFALMISFLLFNEELIDHGEKRFSMSLVLPMILLGIVLAAAPFLPDQAWVPQVMKSLPPMVGAGIAVFGLLIIGLPASGLAGRNILIAVGIFMTAIHIFPRYEMLPAILWEVPVYAGIGIGLLGVALFFVPTFTLDQRIVRNAIFSMATVIGLMAYVNKDNNSRADVSRTAQYLASMEQLQVPIAHVGEYEGQFHYYGRLSRSVTSISPETLTEWVAQNPRGIVITYANAWQPDALIVKKIPKYSAPFTDTEVRIWKASVLAGA